MFKIYDGRTAFYQWDLDRMIVVSDPNITEVHFASKAYANAYVAKVFYEGTERVANVPNVILQNPYRVKVYGYCDDKYTNISASFEVIERAKPDDYIYTEKDIYSLSQLTDTVDSLVETLEYYKRVWYPRQECVLAPTILPTNADELEEAFALPFAVEGEVYGVLYDKSGYNRTTKAADFMGYPGIYLGNLYVLPDEMRPENAIDTGEPFVFVSLFGESVGFASSKVEVSIYTDITDKVEIVSVENRVDRYYEFVSPVEFKEGDVVYLKSNGKYYGATFTKYVGDEGDALLTAYFVLALDNGIALSVMRNGTCLFTDFTFDVNNPSGFEIFQATLDYSPTTISDVFLPKPDDALSLESERPVQNKVLAQIIADLTSRLESLEGK